MSIRESLNVMRERSPILQDVHQGDWEAFVDYFCIHPMVWRYFVKFAVQARAKGKKRYSADSLMHRVRWECEIEGGEEEYKINNNHVSVFVILLAAKTPDFVDFFEFRVLRKKEAA